MGGGIEVERGEKGEDREKARKRETDFPRIDPNDYSWSNHLWPERRISKYKLGSYGSILIGNKGSQSRYYEIGK